MTPSLTILEELRLDSTTTQFRVKLAPASIVFVQACIESYEGLATIRTQDNEIGILEITTTRDLEEECKELIHNLNHELRPSM